MKLWDSKTPMAVFFAVIAIIVGFSVYQSNHTQPPTPPPTTSNESSPSATLTTVYEGQLPCADCPGIVEQITLNKDNPETTGGAYLQKDTYLEKGPPIEEKGQWVITENFLVLTPENGDTKYFDYSPDKIEMLDQDKKKIDSPFNQSLTRKP